MSIEQAVIENLRDMSPEAQRQVLDYVQTLRRSHCHEKPSLQALHGLWADLSFNISEEDFAEMRREMWGGFPREIEP